MAKKQTSGLPSIKQEDELEKGQELELVEDEKTTVSTQERVQWITIRVPVCLDSREDLGEGYLPVRADTGPRPLPREERVSLKAVIRGLSDSGEALNNGTACGDKRTTALRWILERITDAVK